MWTILRTFKSGCQEGPSLLKHSDGLSPLRNEVTLSLLQYLKRGRLPVPRGDVVSTR